MNAITLKTLTTGALLLSIASACSQPAPHLGSTKTTAVTDGASVELSQSRSILSSGGLAGEESMLTQIRAKVEAVDVASRSLTLKLPSGELRTFVIPSEVRNFSQIQTGDVVKVAYHQKVAFELREPTAEEVAVSDTELSTAGRARLGELPGGIATTQKLVIVTIDSVSKDKGQLDVRTSDGRIVTIQAAYPENLALVKKGQKAVINYGESVVATVERLQ